MLSPNMPGVNGHQALPQGSHGVNGHQALHQASSPVNSPVNNLVHTSSLVNNPVNTPVNTPVNAIVNSEDVKNLEVTLANALNSSIREHLSNTLDDLLQEKLPRISKELSNNTLLIANNDEEISFLKEENLGLRLKVEGLLGEVQELKHRVNNQDKLIKNNSLQLSDVSESIDNINKSDLSDKSKYSDVTLALTHTNNVQKVSTQPNPTPSEVTPAHIVLPEAHQPLHPNPPLTRSANYSQVASAHLGPPKALHVQPPQQDTIVPDHNKDQLKINLKKARRTIGISPIKREDLNFWCDTNVKDTKDEDIYYGDTHEETRRKAAVDYLSNWLLFKEDEIKIQSSKMAKDPTTNILWLTMEESDVIKIFKRSGRVKNPKVKLHTFFPHQVWERKTTLQNLCLLEKQSNKEMKFMIKPGVTDIELFVKQKGDPNWIKTNLKAFGNIPPIKYQFNPKEQLVPKLRQSESASASSKRKAITPIKTVSKKHLCYKSPDHAFEDVPESIEDTEKTLESELMETNGNINNGD